MKPKVPVFIACSLDGYIARKDGSLDWLERANAVGPKGEVLVLEEIKAFDFEFLKMWYSVKRNDIG